MSASVNGVVYSICSFKICEFVTLAFIYRESKMEARQGDSFVYYSKALHVHHYGLVS